MRIDAGLSGIKSGKMIFLLAMMCFVLFPPPKSHAGYSHGPRQLGEVVLDEVLMGAKKFVICVGSGGCTAKGSFKIDVKKEEGLSKISPHYVLTVIRTHPDECKAIVDGSLFLFDLEKDLGIKGEFTYSLTNQVYSSSADPMWNDSLLSIVEKQLSLTPLK